MITKNTLLRILENFGKYEVKARYLENDEVKHYHTIQWSAIDLPSQEPNETLVMYISRGRELDLTIADLQRPDAEVTGENSVIRIPSLNLQLEFYTLIPAKELLADPEPEGLQISIRTTSSYEAKVIVNGRELTYGYSNGIWSYDDALKDEECDTTIGGMVAVKLASTLVDILQGWMPDHDNPQTHETYKVWEKLDDEIADDLYRRLI